MGGKRKKEKSDEFFLTSSPMEGISLKSLADSLNLVLQTVKENSTTLNELNVNLKGLDQRISKIEESVLESKLEVEGIKPKVISLEVETNDLKNHISVMVDENSLLKSQLSSLRHTMMKLEIKETDKNILVWNVTAIDTVNAKAIFDGIISSCLGIHEVLKYTIADVKPEKKLIKVIMENMGLIVAVPKQARNLRGKTIMCNQNGFLSYYSPPSVREVRKKLLAIRTSIREKTGFETWIARSIPPSLCIRLLKEGPVEMFLFDEIPPDISRLIQTQRQRRQGNGRGNSMNWIT